MSRKKNVFFEYDNFHHDGDAECDEDKTPIKHKKSSIFDFVRNDLELTELSASTTMTALDVASIMSSPSKDRQQTNVDGQENAQHNVDQIMTAISTVSKQLSDCGGSFVDLRTRMEKLEATLSPVQSNDGQFLKKASLPKAVNSKSSAFENYEVRTKSVHSDADNGPFRSKTSKLRYIHYTLRKHVCSLELNIYFSYLVVLIQIKLQVNGHE